MQLEAQAVALKTAPERTAAIRQHLARVQADRQRGWSTDQLSS